MWDLFDGEFTSILRANGLKKAWRPDVDRHLHLPILSGSPAPLLGVLPSAVDVFFCTTCFLSFQAQILTYDLDQFAPGRSINRDND